MIPEQIKLICKDNTSILDVPEVSEIIEYYESLLLDIINLKQEIVENIKDIK